MKKQILNISPIQTGKVIAVLYFIMSLPLVALMVVGFSFSPEPNKPSMGFMMLIPFAYLILGFIITAIGAWFYNMVAKWVGGIEYTAVSIDKP